MLYFESISDPSSDINKTELKAGIFARRAMVDQARWGLCYQRETLFLYA